MKIKRFLALALSVCMILSFAMNAFAVDSGDRSVSENLDFTRVENQGILIQDPAAADLAVEQSMISPDGMVNVIIVMEGPSIVEQDADAVINAVTKARIDALEARQNQVLAVIEDDVLGGAELEISHSYTWLLNAVATRIPYGAMDAIRAVEGVAQVVIEPVYQLCVTDDAEINTITDGVMIGRENTWANGYTGKGMKIAVIDTGLDLEHQNFQALPEDALTAASATAESIAPLLSELNASLRAGSLSIEDVYHNTKVVFGYNYSDDRTDISHNYDTRGDHGTHVAGIAAANKAEGSDVVGVAPDAQLFIMKVFGAQRSGYASDIIAALEDALILQVDVVNMSLGSAAGFTTSGVELIDAIYARVAETDTVLSVSAGNNYTAGFGNLWGTDANLASNPDNSVIGEPAIYQNVLSVASVENLMIQRNYIQVSDGYRMGFVETSVSYGLPSVMDLEGEVGIVSVPDFGTPEAYTGLDVSGKIALVQRGGISFVEKIQNAQDAGAAACIVWNNTTDEFGMDLTDSKASIPAISITMADGEYLVAALARDSALTLAFPKEVIPMPSATAYQMSDFSSWGVAPDLTLEPDITAPGGNIYSTINGGEYGLMSGTSMAAPNISGITALVMQYVRDNCTGDVRTMAQNLMVSSSVPLPYGEDGLYYSPRSQGSGVANAFNAVTTGAYLTVEGADMPKVSLGDDAGKTGVYGYTFQVHNFSNRDLYYTLNTVVQSEDVVSYGDIHFMASAPIALNASVTETSGSMALVHDVDNSGSTGSHDAYLIYQAAGNPTGDWTDTAFRYDVNGDETVTDADVQAYLDALVGNESEADLEAEVLRVGAGQSADVSVSVMLAGDAKTWLDTYYVNGGYVEGFTFLNALNAGGVDLSLPYLGFYGDWDSAPILDDGNYWDLLNAEEGAVVGNQYYNVLFTNFYGQASYVYPGMNAYVEEAFDPAHISVSPNEDGYFDTVDEIYTSLLRNAGVLTYRYSNAETGEVYYEQSVGHVSKTVYNTGYGQIVPTVYSWMEGTIPLWDWKDAQGNDLTNNTKLLLEVEAAGAFEGAEPETWSVPITVDLEAPILDSLVKTTAEDGTVSLTLNFRENLATSVVALMNSNGAEIYHMEPVVDPEPGEDGYRSYSLTYDITGLEGKMMIILSDYALNEATFALNLGGEGTPYGELVAYQYNIDADTSGWVSFGGDVAGDEVQITLDAMNFVSAEYVNGYVFAQTENGDLYGFRYEDMLLDSFDLETCYIAQLDNVYQDMAYSYAEGKLYGLFTYEDRGYPTTELHSINIKGEYYDENLWSTVMPYQEDWVLGRGGLYGLSLAIDEAGTVYVLGLNYDHDTEALTETAHLWSVGIEYDQWSDSWMLGWALSDLGDVGVSMDYLQSMTYDHNTKTLYWARFDAVGFMNLISELYVIDPSDITEITDENGEVIGSMVGCEKVGDLTSETCAMFAPLTAETIASNEIYTNVPPLDSNEIGKPILREDVITMNVGGVRSLSYDLDPWYTDHKTVVWSSSDEGVVTVNDQGVITAVAAGSAVITVANAADESCFDTVNVEVTALDLKLEGIISAQTAGVGATTGVSTYEFVMVDGTPEFGTVNPITAPTDLNYGLSLATSVMGRGSIWACEYGNTGMIYEINPATGEVVDVLEPVDGDMLFGMTYSEKQDTFAGIMNMYLFADLKLTHEEREDMINSYDEAFHGYTYHRINLLPYLIESNDGFITGETGQGASSEIVFCGITTLDGGFFFEDTYRDYLGNWVYDGSVNYTADQTLLLLDNVGRLWYIDEVIGMTKTADEWGNAEYTSENGSYIMTVGQHRKGMFELEIEDENGNVTYNVFNIRKVEETPLTQQFREGTMPRITYHFSDIELAGYTADGAPMIAMSLYDYWNNGTTNELYLYIPGVGTGEWVMDYETWESYEVMTPSRFYNLGNTGKYNIIASIHSAEVTGGVEEESAEEFTPTALAAGAFRGERS